MSRHTSGPWRAGNWGQSIVSDTPIQGGINGSDAVESYGGHLIAESISECNRPLIIATPDLFEALAPFAALAELFDDCKRAGTMPTSGVIMSWPRIGEGGMIIRNELTVEHLRAARAVMAKARGEA